jgi:short-subunit dehydrogenase
LPLIKAGELAKAPNSVTVCLFERSREEIKALAELIRRDVGEITMIVNNAGISHFKSFMECSEDEFISTLRVNLFSSYWILKEFLPSMISKNHGHIVTIANSAGNYHFVIKIIYNPVKSEINF